MIFLSIAPIFILAAIQEAPTESKPSVHYHEPTVGDPAQKKKDEAFILTLRLAAQMSDRKRDPVRWASTQLLLGIALKEHHELPEAETVMRSALEEIEIAHREDEAGYLRFRAEYASLLVDAGKLKDAEIVYKKLLPVAASVFGKKNVKNLSIRSDYLMLQVALRQFGDAEIEAKSILDDGLSVLGAEDPNMIDARMQLANALTYQSKNAEAEPHYRAVIPLIERMYGSVDGRTLLIRYNLALCLRGQKKYVEALDLAHQIENGAQQGLSKDDPLQKDFEKLRKEMEEATAKGSGK